MKLPLLIIHFSLLFASLPLIAQVELSPRFARLLNLADIDFITPVEAKYRDVPVFKNSFQEYDFAIRSRKEKMEIRYLVKPFSEDRSSGGLSAYQRDAHGNHPGNQSAGRGGIRS